MVHCWFNLFSTSYLRIGWEKERLNQLNIFLVIVLLIYVFIIIYDIETNPNVSGYIPLCPLLPLHPYYIHIKYIHITSILHPYRIHITSILPPYLWKSNDSVYQPVCSDNLQLTHRPSVIHESLGFMSVFWGYDIHITHSIISKLPYWISLNLITWYKNPIHSDPTSHDIHLYPISSETGRFVKG